DRILQASRHYYGDDSEDISGQDLYHLGRRALLKRTEVLLNEDTIHGIAKQDLDSATWLRKTSESHDDYGNVVWMVDALGDPKTPAAGHSRSFEFDPLLHAHHVRESVHLSASHVLTATATYDLAFSALTSLTDFNQSVGERRVSDS